MKERPILYKGPMVCGILEDRKTMTRRHINALLGFGQVTEFRASDTPGYDWAFRDRRGHWNEISHARLLQTCPYGQPGDQLWVRETWAVQRAEPCLPHEQDWQELLSPTIRYLADGSTRRIHGDRSTGIGCYRGMVEKARPSIHMPRWASRLTLEITGVRVERLHDMEGQGPYPGESNALAEGMNAINHGDGAYYYSAFRDEPHPKNWCDPTDAFRELWESINGAGSWDENPWVWVVEFKRITKAYEEASRS